uniref:Uncharacterized protein n=1 Tax=Arundo donax TaxID=35708 RepID=A0A0A8Y5P3_ARUDO
MRGDEVEGLRLRVKGDELYGPSVTWP